MANYLRSWARRITFPRNRSGANAVMLGASEEPSPIPRAPTAVYDAPLPPEPLFVTVMEQRVADAVGLVTTTEAVMVEPLVTEAPLSVTPTQVPKATVAPDWKPPPEIEMAVVVLPAAPGIKIADGLTVEISLPRMVKIGPEVKLPPSALVTVTV